MTRSVVVRRAFVGHAQRQYTHEPALENGGDALNGLIERHWRLGRELVTHGLHH